MQSLNKIIGFCFVLIIFKTSLYAQVDSGFVKIPEGKYFVGKKNIAINPPRNVYTKSFYISKYEITNRQFQEFVNATNYKTEAEKLRNAMVFEPGLQEFRWIQDSTAYWKYPNGISRGDIKNKMNHPVTCICYKDALAYCKWAGMRLPTLEEWEIASRAGSEDDYFWGNDGKKIAEYANIWHGRNHLTADSSDGYMYTAPVGSYKPNPFGLYDVYGNVFEFCTGKILTDGNKNIAHARGGSWWCSKNSCNFFNSYDIGNINVYASFSNLGFRVVKENIR
jgi:sulfatase modifying factor 1